MAAIDHGMAILDRQGRITLWNDALERMLGSSRGDVLGRPLLSAVEGAEAQDLAALILRATTTGLPQSLDALRWLQAQGAEQIYFKYCSTFDSTPEGNIGPVTEALMQALNCDFTIACPAFPAAGRTIYKGHLFVGDVPLDESGMRDHPLTPMRDANLVRVLQAQMQGKVGLIDYADVARGPEAIRARIDALKAAGVKAAIVDVLNNEDLLRLGCAVRDLPLVTAGSGVAIGLPQNYALSGVVANALPRVNGFRAVVSGSCSVATNAQVAHFKRQGGAARALDVAKLAAGEPEIACLLDWAKPLLATSPVLIYSTAEPADVQAIQSRLGAANAGQLIENALASLASALVEAGVDQMVVAGGETSGAVVQALGIEALRIGPQIDPGVPWTMSIGDKRIALVLKSGNFGGEDFFVKAFQVLQR
mgnify:CR=1 FL=1